MRANKNAANLAAHGSPEAKAFDAAQDTDPEPEDIGLDVGTKERAIWENVLRARKVTIDALNTELIIETAFLKLAEQKVAEERAKFK